MAVKEKQSLSSCRKDRPHLTSPSLIAVMLVIATALPAFWLCRALMPLFLRYALARPNSRSSHAVPTPQGGGFAILCVAMGAAIICAMGLKIVWPPESLAVLIGMLVLMGIGGLDDIKPLPTIPRLITQIAVIGIIILSMPDTIRLLPEAVPLWAERLLAGLALLWFVNLVNFMDGIDWITAAELLPVWVVVLVVSLWADETALVVLAAILIGSYLGFVPFNRPVAKLFLGDVGSLPLGLVTGWLLYRIGAKHGLVSALLPPLYYLADATITMMRRALRGEKIWEAHRTHFYQQATTKGLTVLQIVARILITNLVLAGLALAAHGQSLSIALALLVTGALCVAALIREMQRDRRAPQDPINR